MYLEILFSIYKARTECIFKIFLQRTYFWRPGFLSRSILRRLRHRKFVPYRPVCPATWPRRTSWCRGRGRQTALVHSWRQSSPGPRHHTQQRRPKHNKDGTRYMFPKQQQQIFVFSAGNVHNSSKIWRLRYLQLYLFLHPPRRNSVEDIDHPPVSGSRLRSGIEPKTYEQPFLDRCFTR